MSLDLIRSTGQGASAIGTRGSLSSNKRGGVIPHDEGRIYRDGMEGDRIHSHGDGVGAGDIGNVRRTEEQQAEAEAGKSPVAGAVDGDSKGRGEIRPIVSRGRSEKERQEKIATIKKQAKLKRPWGLTWRSSSWYITTIVAVGIATDIITYNIIVPVLPYRLQSLDYTNISELTSWLFFAYSIGIFVATFPVAWFFSRHPYRRGPLVIGVMVLIGSLLLIMLAEPYWVMVLSRFIGGAASTIVWIVGFALLCENVEEKNIGRQIGFAISGLSVGTTIAPPIGGALYWRLGWHSPFIFCIILCVVDLLARLLVIEQKDIYKYAIKAKLQSHVESPESSESAPSSSSPVTLTEPTIGENEKGRAARSRTPFAGNIEDVARRQAAVKALSPWAVLGKLITSPRGVNAFVLTFVNGLVIGALDPTLTLRVQSVWHKNSDFVGLVYLAAAAPTFITGPIMGALADKYGGEWLMFPAVVLTLPFFPLMILKKSLPGFVVTFALAETLLSMAVGPTGLELALAARKVEGMSEIHQFAAMNLGFAVSTAIGAIAGGQIYDHLSNGWQAVCWFCFASIVICLPTPFILGGNKSLYRRLVEYRSSQKAKDGETCEQIDVGEVDAGTRDPQEERVTV